MIRSAVRAASRVLVLCGVSVLVGAVGPAGAKPQSVARYDHVFMMVEENHGFTDIIGNPAAPTLNALASHYGLATQYYGTTHPSGPSYVAMLGGSSFGVNSDDPYWDFGVHAPSLTSQLDTVGLSWRGYYQGMPYAGYRGYCWPVRCLGVPDSDTLYIAKHNGIVYFNSVNGNPGELAKMRPLSGLERDLGSGHVPAFSYVMPDECHDMHGAPPVCVDSGSPRDINDNWLVSTADAFVAAAVYRISHSPVWRSGNNAIVINFDEGDDNAGCCGTNPGGGRALAIVITNHGEHAISDATPYNHYSLLATLEGVYGLPCLAGACGHDIKTLSPLFDVTGAPGQPVPADLLRARLSLDPNPPVGAEPPVRAGTSAPVPGPLAPPSTPGHWQAVPAPNLSLNDNNLAAVSAGSPTSAIAVGDYYTNENPNVFRNLAEHWDGTRWRAIAPPNVGEQENTLFSVSALRDGTAWAVGYYADQTFRIRTLTEYWNGTRWSVVPSANPARERDTLFSVKAVGAHDVWAVGGAQDTANGAFHTLIEHWDGTRWSVVPNPDPGPTGNALYGVTAAGPGNAWAVGQQLGTGFPSRALVEHWDGTRWSVASAPAAAAESYDPYAAAVRDGRLLAAGDRESDVVPQRTLSFTNAGVLPSENIGTGENDFYAVASGFGETWAAGRVTAPVTDAQTTLIESLHNGQWSVVPSPTPGAGGGGLGGITIDPSGQAWAVGVDKTSDSANRALIERWVR